MTSTIKFWTYDLSINIGEIQNEISRNSSKKTSLLDWNKDNYTLYEKFVHDTSKFHLEQNGYTDYKDIFVEFWCKSKFDTHKLHVDCDESKKKGGTYEYALFTCLTYFNENNCPTIITNIDHEKYIYKSFNDESELMLVYPRPQKQITFDGKYYHGSTIVEENIDNERYIIAINFWKNRPDNVEYYLSFNEELGDDDGMEECPLLSIMENTDVKIGDVSIENRCNQYKMFNDIVYIGNKEVWKPFSCDIIAHENAKILFKCLTVEKKQTMDELKTEMDAMYNRKEKLNRFYQRGVLHRFFTKEVCNWIITETENYACMTGGWTTRRHTKYPTTDIPVERIPHVFNLVIASLGGLFEKMLKFYGLDNDIVKIDVADLFVVKYDEKGQQTLDMHNDGSFLTFNMALNGESEYEGGGTLFEDGVITKIGQGDVLWHCGQVKHGGLPITKGKRYLLVGFLNVKF